MCCSVGDPRGGAAHGHAATRGRRLGLVRLLRVRRRPVGAAVLLHLVAGQRRQLLQLAQLQRPVHGHRLRLVPPRPHRYAGTFSETYRCEDIDKCEPSDSDGKFSVYGWLVSDGPRTLTTIDAVRYRISGLVKRHGAVNSAW